MLSWETFVVVVESDDDLQGEFNKPPDKKYTWAMLIIKIEINGLTSNIDKSTLLAWRHNYIDKSPTEQPFVPLEHEAEIDLFDFVDENEFAFLKFK